MKKLYLMLSFKSVELIVTRTASGSGVMYNDMTETLIAYY